MGGIPSRYELNLSKYDNITNGMKAPFGKVQFLSCSKSQEKLILAKIEIGDKKEGFWGIQSSLEIPVNLKILKVVGFSCETKETFCTSGFHFYVLFEVFEGNLKEIIFSGCNTAKEELKEGNVLKCILDIGSAIQSINPEERNKCEISLNTIICRNNDFLLIHPNLWNLMKGNKNNKKQGNSINSLAFVCLQILSKIEGSNSMDQLFLKARPSASSALMSLLEWMVSSGPPSIEEVLAEASRIKELNERNPEPSFRRPEFILQGISKENSVLMPSQHFNSNLQQTNIIPKLNPLKPQGQNLSQSQFAKALEIKISRQGQENMQTIHFENGGKFEGGVRGGQMHGFGRLYNENSQIVYEGQFNKNMFHGQGIIYNFLSKPSKSINPSDFSSALQVSWTRYEGEFKNDSKEGFGCLYFVNNEHFIGGFVKDKIQGQGCFTKGNGKELKGIWKDNKKI